MGHGVDLDEFSAGRRTRPRPAAPVRIGYVGRLSAEKHVRRLADVDRALASAGVAHSFAVVGDGAERPWLERHLPAGSCLGVLTGERLARAYADMDVFVFPSTSDTFGLVVLEAMASGVPVVAIAAGGPKYVVDTGESGWLTTGNDELIAAVVRLARDPLLRERLGQGARRRAAAWSWDAVFDGVYDAYRTVMAAGAAVPSAVPAA
jgi:phosphatidylinositol alpha 1,6-mannosyltransferase